MTIGKCDKNIHAKEGSSIVEDFHYLEASIKRLEKQKENNMQLSTLKCMQNLVSKKYQL